MEGRNLRITTADRIALSATLAVTILILAMLCVTAKAEMKSFSEVAPFAVPPTIGMPSLETGHGAPMVSATGRRC